MRKNRFLVVTVLSVAIVCTTTFVSCKKDKSEEPNITYTLTVLSNDNKMGTITGSGSYTEGTEATLTATPASEACVFVKWSDGNTENPRTLTVTENMELTATFGYAFVDLGLPSGVKWAACNVGATTPEGYGGYFAWGETETKDICNWSTYFDTTDGGSTFTEYTAGGKTMLDKKDDAAAVNMGGAWRMPTREEINELIANCTWTYTTTYNGKSVKGYVVTSQTNGNSIFLPAAGYQDQSAVGFVGSIGQYWTSNLYTASESKAWELWFNQSQTSKPIKEEIGGRYVGRHVRAVMK